MQAPKSRPWLVAATLAILAEALFCFRLTTPSKLMFDEVHYVPAARAMLALSAPANTEHPLVGKEMIALGIRLFGDDALGWRALSTLAGAATVLGVFAIAMLMFGRVRTATIAALLTALNFTVYIEARIAMLDGFMAAFVVLAVTSLLWSMRARGVVTAWSRWVLGAVLLGLAIGAKWAALPFLVYAGAGFLAVRGIEARARGRSVWWALNAGGHAYWPGLAAVPALMVLGAVTVAVYFATFAPMLFYKMAPMHLDHLLAFQREMYAQQTQVLPHHPYQSQWWSWPLMIRPIWYLYEVADGAQRGVFFVGNPAVMWGGLVAVIACWWATWRERSAKLAAAAGLWAGAYLPWIVIPKSLGFFYYYYLPSIFLPVAIAAALGRFCKGRWEHWDEAYLIVAAALFVIFFPILSAAPLHEAQDFRRWMWFPSWP